LKTEASSEEKLDIRKKLFTMRVVKHSNRSSREVVEAPAMETFKATLDGAPSNLVEDVPAHCRAVRLHDL